MRLRASIWVSAYLARLQLAGMPAYVIAHGDDTAGSVLIKINRLDGTAVVYQRGFDLTLDRNRWQILTEGDEAAVDVSIGRQRGFDPDLWVIEVESRDGRSLLDEEGLE